MQDVSKRLPFDLRIPLMVKQGSNSGLERPQREERYDGSTTIIPIQNTAGH